MGWRLEEKKKVSKSPTLCRHICLIASIFLQNNLKQFMFAPNHFPFERSLSTSPISFSLSAPYHFVLKRFVFPKDHFSTPPQKFSLNIPNRPISKICVFERSLFHLISDVFFKQEFHVASNPPHLFLISLSRSCVSELSP